jgi:hypothetical protein
VRAPRLDVLQARHLRQVGVAHNEGRCSVTSTWAFVAIVVALLLTQDKLNKLELKVKALEKRMDDGA